MHRLWSSWLSMQSSENFWWYYTFEAHPCKVCHWNLRPLRVHLLAIYTSQLVKAQIKSVCSQMSITVHKICHQDHLTCTKSKSSWPTRYNMYVLSIRGRSRRSYNMLGIQMHVGQTKHSPEVWSRHSITWTTSRSQMCTGAKPPYPVESTAVTGSNTVSTQHESQLKY